MVEEDMAKKKPEPTAQNLTIRVEDELLGRLTRIASALSERAQGVPINRSAAIRAVLIRGADEIESELGLAKKTKR